MADYFFYKGQMYKTDELKHWKYVKREKKNGKWYYYYDDSEVDKARQKRDKALADVNTSYSKLSSAKNFTKTYGAKKSASDNIDAAARNVKRREVETAYRKKVLDSASKNLSKVAIKHLAVAPVAMGAAFIANLLGGHYKVKKK